MTSNHQFARDLEDADADRKAEQLDLKLSNARYVCPECGDIRSHRFTCVGGGRHGATQVMTLTEIDDHDDINPSIR